MEPVTFTESRPSDVLENLHQSAEAEREYLFASHDAGKNDLILVAWYMERAIGYLAATDERPNDLLIWEHAVAPEFRQRGIGRQLLLEAAKRTVPSARICIDPMGQLDVQRVTDYYLRLGFEMDEDTVAARAGDIVAALAEQREDTTPLSALLAAKTPDVVTVDPDASIADALRLMNEQYVGAIVVSDDGHRVQGILSERDMLVGIDMQGADFLDQPVVDHAKTDVLTAAASDSIYEVMEAMTVRRIRHVPITDAGRLIGIVSVGDVLLFRLSQLNTAS